MAGINYSVKIVQVELHVQLYENWKRLHCSQNRSYSQISWKRPLTVCMIVAKLREMLETPYDIDI